MSVPPNIAAAEVEAMRRAAEPRPPSFILNMRDVARAWTHTVPVSRLALYAQKHRIPILLFNICDRDREVIAEHIAKRLDAVFTE